MLKKRSLVSLSAVVILLSFFTIILASDSSKIRIRAAIIPHHLVAVEFIDDLAQKLASAPPPQIIIIGPNHDEVGDNHFLTDPGLLAKDHACFAPRDVLQKYLPKTKISCVLISFKVSPTEINNFAKILSKTLGDKGVLVASVDFSHYQTLSQASENDLLTQKYLENFDSNSLSPLDNSFLDSPRTIALLFKYLSLNSIAHFSLINHSNSAIILNQFDSPSTTSYFEYLYY